MQQKIFAPFNVAKICRDLISFSIFSLALVNTVYVFEIMAIEHRIYFFKKLVYLSDFFLRSCFLEASPECLSAVVDIV